MQKHWSVQAAPYLGRYIPCGVVCQYFGISRDRLVKLFKTKELTPHYIRTFNGVSCAIAELDAMHQEMPLAELVKNIDLINHDGIPRIDENGYIPWSIALAYSGIHETRLRDLIYKKKIEAKVKNRGDIPKRIKIVVQLDSLRSWLAKHERAMTRNVLAGHAASAPKERGRERRSIKQMKVPKSLVKIELNGNNPPTSIDATKIGIKELRAAIPSELFQTMNIYQRPVDDIQPEYIWRLDVSDFSTCRKLCKESGILVERIPGYITKYRY